MMSNPYFSTIAGAVIGLLVALGGSRGLGE